MKASAYQGIPEQMPSVGQLKLGWNQVTQYNNNLQYNEKSALLWLRNKNKKSMEWLLVKVKASEQILSKFHVIKCPKM